MRRLAVSLLALGLAAPAAAAVKPGLEGARDLFRRNHWEEARAHLRAQWQSLPAQDRPAASFLIGRSYVREAELYRALRQVGVEIGLAYFEELAKERSNRREALLPLFAAFYQLEAGDEKAAARALRAAAVKPALDAAWRTSARLRHAVALRRLGRPATLTGSGVEARYWRLVETGKAEMSSGKPVLPRERVQEAAILFRARRSMAAEQLLAGIDLDRPDAESATDPRKVLRFHDPLVASAWERICWERAVIALRPLAVGGGSIEASLAAYYTGLGLLELGVRADAAAFLQRASGSSLPGPLQSSVKVLLAACSWGGRAPGAAELLPLWEATQAQPESVLVWEDLSRTGPPRRVEPFASRLEAREQGLLSSLSERPSGAVVGRWALARLHRGADAGSLMATLAEHRDDSNKNKIDWNDPLLLVAIVAANHHERQYAQALETLFELSKSLPGLRWVQWNLQGVYAARQKAGGETRISQ